jgi:hypothetical protein
MPRQALFFHRRPLDPQNDNHCTRVSWGSVLSAPQQPPQLRLDLASTAVSQQRNDARTSTTVNRTSSTAPRMPHRPIDNITVTPQGLPARTGARRHSNTHSARPAFFSKAPLGFCCKPRPSSCVYKRGEQGALKKTQDKRFLHFSD